VVDGAVCDEFGSGHRAPALHRAALNSQSPRVCSLRGYPDPPTLNPNPLPREVAATAADREPCGASQGEAVPDDSREEDQAGRLKTDSSLEGEGDRAGESPLSGPGEAREVAPT
jgi:hypothetical protein